MKLTKTKLKQIIKEEIQKALKEGFPDIPVGASPSRGRRQYNDSQEEQIEGHKRRIEFLLDNADNPEVELDSIIASAEEGSFKSVAANRIKAKMSLPSFGV